jgi:chaperonin cofactor prefoldin
VVLREERLDHVHRAVGAAVVDHDHLEVRHELREALERLADDDLDVWLLVVGRQHD